MSEAHRIAGQKGGLATLERHGNGHFSAIGQLGGRPTWQQELEMYQQRRERVRAQKRKGGVSPSIPHAPA